MANYAKSIKARENLITLMLREDHQKIRQLFDQFRATTNKHEKWNIVTAALAALEVHAKLEEELIYPAWREHVDERNLVVEAHHEHHVAHMLIKELKKMDPEDMGYDAKFVVLSTHVTHHIDEEEGKMFPQAEKAVLDWQRLTKQVIERRQSLDQKPLWLLGVPVVFASEKVCATRTVLSGRSGG
ncbi:MAG TPA: hemerythrin domain-containing protein [Nitrospiraceae bacterium]|jgi:hemerythrin superfamily protein|nr:hemerythrin domain-containing protein [Nitrospiraceae bacterium]